MTYRHMDTGRHGRGVAVARVTVAVAVARVAVAVAVDDIGRVL
jgi:hypothetical protein